MMNMATIRVSEAEAIRNIAQLLDRAFKGDEIIIEKAMSLDAALAVLRTVIEPPTRKLSDSLRLAKEHGSTVTLDGGFARDLEAAVNSHPEPMDRIRLEVDETGTVRIQHALPTLDELVAGITPENRYTENQAGITGTAGKEAVEW